MKKKLPMLQFRCTHLRIVISVLASTLHSLFLLFQDGGLLINNPTALAIHECKCLWPNTPLQCVLSLGTGRYETAGKNGTTYTSLKAKLANVISSATDTEGRFKPLVILQEPSVTPPPLNPASRPSSRGAHHA